MNLRALSCLRTIAELGTILKASAHLRIAQPALTRQLQRLEHSLGVELLHRAHKGVRPTAAGCSCWTLQLVGPQALSCRARLSGDRT